MGRGRGKGKRLSLTKSHEDGGSGEEEKIPIQKKRGRPQKPLKDDMNENEFNDDSRDNEGAIDPDSGNKRKQYSESKNQSSPVKEETKSSGFRHMRSRRKSTPHRAAEVGVKGTIFLGLEASPHQLAGISS